MGFDLGGLLQQVLGSGATNPQDAQDQFHQVAQAAPPDLLSQGLAAMFRSDQTPPFSQMAGQLFGQSSTTQQAGMLNQLLAGIGPQLLSSLAGGAGSAGLAAMLTRFTQGGNVSLTPDQAAQLTPEQVQQIATHAEQHNPGVIDQVSSFYAEHPGLVKTVGSAALTIVLAKMAEGRRA